MSQDRMTDAEWAIDPTCPIERVGGEWLVIHTGNGMESSVLRLSAASAEVLTRLRRGPAPLPEYLMDAASELEVWGVVYPVRTDPGLNLGRRQFIRMGAGGAAVGIAVLSLPNAAAASSGPIQASGGTVATFTYDGTCYKSHRWETATTASFTVTSGAGLVDVLIVGGGGAGGLGLPDDGGGGGGGGGQVIESLGVSISSASSPYSIVIGSGGTAPGDGTGLDGGNGQSSSALGISASGGTGGIGALGSRDGGRNDVYVAGTGSSDAGGGGAGAQGNGGNASTGVGGSGGTNFVLLSNQWSTGGASVAGGGGGGGTVGGSRMASGGQGGFFDETEGEEVGPGAGTRGGGGGGALGGTGGANGGSGRIYIRYPCPP